MLQGRQSGTCSRRALNDDMMDTYYTLLINAGNGPRVRDGLDRVTVAASCVLPYPAPPNPPKTGRGSEAGL